MSRFASTRRENVTHVEAIGKLLTLLTPAGQNGVIATKTAFSFTKSLQMY